MQIIVLFFITLSSQIFSINSETERIRPIVLTKYPHNKEIFTEGLSIDGCYLFEAAGLYGESAITCMDLSSGKIISKQSLPQQYFGEGIATLSDRVVQITWKERTAFVFDRPRLNLIQTIPFEGEGWGLCNEGDLLWMSNGTSTLKKCHKNDLSTEKVLSVHLNGHPISSLNDIAIAHRHLYANVWPEEYIIRIDKETGAVDAIYDTSQLLSPEEKTLLGPEDVLNGITYHPDKQTFFITGKRWPWIFEVQLPDPDHLTDGDVTIEEKVGQLLIVHFNGEVANNVARRLINECHIGGFIFYKWANGLTDPNQVKTLTRSLNTISKSKKHPIPLFLCLDQEGGIVKRLSEGFTHFPGNRALALTGCWNWGYRSALYTGLELAEVGINLNLAPVVDVQPLSTDEVIGSRSYGSNPHDVACWGALAIQGHKDAGVISTLKHFPGHGSTTVDSHKALPSVNKEIEALNHTDLVPFRLLAPKADIIMTGHLMVPALDNEYCTTFSKKIITDLLRKSFLYDGVIMTDSLVMKGILNDNSALEEVVFNSLLAGHDIALLGGRQLNESQANLEIGIDEVIKVHRYLVNAVKTGKYPEQLLNESYERVVALKKKYHLIDWPLNREPIDLEKHRQLAQQIERH